MKTILAIFVLTSISVSTYASDAKFLGCGITRNSFYRSSKGGGIDNHDMMMIPMSEAENTYEQHYKGSFTLPTPVAGTPAVTIWVDVSFDSKMLREFRYSAQLLSVKDKSTEVLMAGSVSSPIYYRKTAVTNVQLTMQNPFTSTLRANNPGNADITVANGFPLDSVVYDSVELQCAVEILN